MTQPRAFAIPDRLLPAAGTLTLADVGQLAQRLQAAGQADAAVALYRQWIAGGPLPMRQAEEAGMTSLTGALPGTLPGATREESPVSFQRAVRRAADAARQTAAR